MSVIVQLHNDLQKLYENKPLFKLMMLDTDKRRCVIDFDYMKKCIKDKDEKKIREIYTHCHNVYGRTQTDWLLGKLGVEFVDE